MTINDNLYGMVPGDDLTLNDKLYRLPEWVAASFVPAVGVVGTVPPGALLADVAWAVADDARYALVREGGTISSIGFHCTVSDGNICVGVYRGEGVGRDRVPTERIATSGEVAAPSVGWAEIPLTDPVEVRPGDFLALSADGTTFAVLGLDGFESDLFAGFSYGEASAHPLPDDAGTLVATTEAVPALIGLP